VTQTEPRRRGPSPTPSGVPSLSAAVIGTGFIGGVHARAARRAGARLVAVGSSSPERSRAAAETFGVSQAISSPDELAEAEGIDVVHICTPNAIHADYAEAALRSGKHVICEKPLAIDLASAHRLRELAADQGCIATVPYVYRFYPTIRHARNRVTAGDLGPLRLLHGSYLQDWMSRPDDWSWRVDAASNGPSRAFADIGSHWCDLVEFVSGHRIRRLVAKLDTVYPQRSIADHAEAFQTLQRTRDVQMHEVTTEDAALVLFVTDQGASGSVVISQVSPGRKNRLWLELDGSDASVIFDQERPETLRVGGRDADTTIHRGSAVMTGDAARLSALPSGHPQGYHDCFDAFVADTYEAITNHAPDGLPTFDDGVRSLKIVEAVLASAQDDRWVEVPA
jgi:predicted dehydrogenase